MLQIPRLQQMRCSRCADMLQQQQTKAQHNTDKLAAAKAQPHTSTQPQRLMRVSLRGERQQQRMHFRDERRHPEEKDGGTDTQRRADRDK